MPTSALPRATVPANAIYFTDAAARPGRIDWVAGGSVSTLHERPAGSLHSVAVSPDGQVYLADANQQDVIRLDGSREVRVYRAPTYVRAVAVSSRGKVYFSEATGAGGDGVIYELDGGEPRPFYTVHLADVRGSWGGEFAFDERDGLWLSSGNRTPSDLFHVVDGKPQRVYTSSDGAIGGFYVEKGGESVVYAGRDRIYRLRLRDGSREVIHAFAPGQDVSGVAPAVR